MRSAVRSGAAAGLLILPLSCAYVVPHRRTPASTRRGIAPLHAIDPSQFLSPDALGGLDHAFDHVLRSSSHLLSDAAAVTANSVDAVKEDDGWWQQYLQVFKGFLSGVHDVVDPPLRSVGITQTWGISIFLFTTMVRLALAPISVQQTKSAEYMKALKPYQDQIKAKFKDNDDMKNRATAKLFEDAKQNPLAGCLVSIIQLPILLALYRSVTLLAKEGRLDEPFLWIPSLEGPVSAPAYRGMEWLTEGWTFADGSLPVPSLGWETTLAFLVMPVILVLGQKFTMSALTAEGGQDTSAMSDEEKEQFEKSQGVLKFLPLLIGFFSLQVPAGLTIYWFTSNLATLVQSLGVKAYYKANPPEIVLPDYWDALEDTGKELSPEQKRTAAEAGINTGPTFQEMTDEADFHYIVPRKPLRLEDPAWARVQASGHAEIPDEFKEWVGGERLELREKAKV